MKLNIGCGKKYDPDYCNIDLYEDLVADRRMSAFNLEFDDNTCDEIKAIHVIEHLSFFETIYALSEFFRVLEPNGKLILETPDLEKTCQHYLKANEEQKKEILGWFFGIPHKGLQHKICFPPYLLTELLSNAGFRSISTEFYYNIESIPSVRFTCKKLDEGYSLYIFQIITKIRNTMLVKNYVDFTDSFVIKEQEDLIANFAVELLKLEKNDKKDKVLEILTDILIKSPKFAKFFLEAIQNQDILSEKEINIILNTSEILLDLKFPNILLNSLKKGLLQPGSQKTIFSSIESFGRSVIMKINQSEKDRSNIIDNFKEMSEDIKDSEIDFFSFKIIKQKSLDYFYKGIKAFNLGKYRTAHNRFLDAIRLYRDDLFYYWNLAKVLTKLDLEDQAIKFFKLTLRFLRLKKFQYKDEIKLDIKKELHWVKSKQGKIPEFEPIISIEKYRKNL
jgi:ubiquinone/menaquinone biosynthesis C-methylase UbiE